MEIRREVFEKMSKADIWEVFNKLQTERVSLHEIKKDTSATLTKLEALDKRVVALEGELSVSKNANSLLKEEISRLERKVLADNQYGRLENIEIAGIPPKSNDSELEDIVVAIANEINVEVEPSDISACHHLGGERGDVIVRFVNRKAADSMFRSAPMLKGLDLSTLLGADHAPVYINPNLCPELKSMRWKARKMKDAGFVARFGTNRRGVYVQKEERGAKTQIFVDGDLTEFLNGTPLSSVLHPPAPVNANGEA